MNRVRLEGFQQKILVHSVIRMSATRKQQQHKKTWSSTTYSLQDKKFICIGYHVVKMRLEILREF